MGKVAYRKVYRVRLFGRGGYETTLPKIILEGAARSKGMTLDKFVKTHRVAFLFNDFQGFHAALRFEPIEDQEILELSEEELKELIPDEPGTKPKQANLFDELRAKLKGVENG